MEEKNIKGQVVIRLNTEFMDIARREVEEDEGQQKEFNWAEGEEERRDIAELFANKYIYNKEFLGLKDLEYYIHGDYVDYIIDIENNKIEKKVIKFLNWLNKKCYEDMDEGEVIEIDGNSAELTWMYLADKEFNKFKYFDLPCFNIYIDKTLTKVLDKVLGKGGYEIC